MRWKDYSRNLSETHAFHASHFNPVILWQSRRSNLIAGFPLNRCFASTFIMNESPQSTAIGFFLLDEDICIKLVFHFKEMDTTIVLQFNKMLDIFYSLHPIHFVNFSFSRVFLFYKKIYSIINKTQLNGVSIMFDLDVLAAIKSYRFRR